MALRRYWGYESLKSLQAEAIACAMAQCDSLTVLPTGGGKSLCYQVPPLLDGSLDVVVSPLISLMKDQVDGLRESGYPAAALHSGMTAAERRIVETALRAAEIRLLFVSPERLMMEDFLGDLKQLAVRRFAIDEAHCISQWGHDFRPEYRQLAVLRQHFPSASLHAYTATATPRVREDIVEQLQLKDAALLVGCFDRANLIYRVLPKTDVREQTAQAIARHAGEAVIAYCLSRKDTETLAAWLKARGVRAAAYHAGMEPEDRHRTQEAFADESLDVVVATVAFGMGIDRSNVRCVIHTSLPKTIEHYQQETGRAGRDGLEAECVLFYSAADVMRWKGIMNKPPAEAPEPGTEADLEAARKIQLELLRGMQRYCTSARCRHKALSEYFGQAYDRADCGACDVCLDEVEEVGDGTVLAQKILSCVARVGQRFGVGHVVNVLLGADTETLRRAGHDGLSTYGLLKDSTASALTALVYQLVDQGLLTRTEGDRPVLKLNEASAAVLRGGRAVRLFQPKERLRKRTARGEKSMEGVDMELFDTLRRWRQEECQRLGIPAYVIFHDTTLAELARARPGRVEDLVGIPGIGEHKQARWGEAVCAIIAACVPPGRVSPSR
ncbi:MAG TPA: DNA helicase RecQ [Kiritimatiellia bacterium]|nr:DNA helicase RecQ [Kiritimatiellia bacterium]HSA19319.1 DNA helicase RecQ [Kiritimatiellia bacterium]